MRSSKRRSSQERASRKVAPLSASKLSIAGAGGGCQAETGSAAAMAAAAVTWLEGGDNEQVATAVALTAGVSAEANTGGGLAAGASGGQNNATTTHGGYRKGMAIFTIAKGGLMYEAALGGQKFDYTPL